MTDYERHFHPAQITETVPHPRGCILICHGMAEHQARYHPVAHYLNQHGWHVVTYDHPGHGPQALAAGTLGQIGSRGWTAMTDRLQEMLDFAVTEADGLPLWVVGHSMGSFTVLDYATRFSLPDTLRGLVLIGTNSTRAHEMVPLKWLSGWQAKRYGANSVSPLVNALTFGAFNRKIKDAQSDVDWVCSNSETLAKYIADPLCGFSCSVGWWHEFSKTMLRLSSNAGLKKLPANCQIILMAGGQDPVGRFGVGPTQLAQRLRRYGPGAELKLYPTLRHEILNETDYRPVWADLQRMVSDFTAP